MSSRTNIWQMAMELIKKSPIIGYGWPRNESEYVIVNSLGYRFSAHNVLLEILLRGGLIALIITIIYLCYAGKKIMSYRKNSILALITCAWGGLLLFYFSETSFKGFFLIPVMMANCSFFVENKKCVKDKS